MSDSKSPAEAKALSPAEVQDMRRFVWRLGIFAVIMPFVPVVLVRIVSRLPSDEAIGQAILLGFLTYPLSFVGILVKLVREQWSEIKLHPLLKAFGLFVISAALCQPVAVLSYISSAVITGLLWGSWTVVLMGLAPFLLLSMMIGVHILIKKFKQAWARRSIATSTTRN